MTEQEAAQQGEALSALFAERHPQMVGYARKWLRAFGVPPASVDAEDVVQNAFARVMKSGRPIERLRPYVFTVIKNEIRHAAQRYRSGLGYGRLDLDVQLESRGPAADPSSATDLRVDLEAAMNRLPPQQRRVMFHKMRGDTQAETATAMGIAPGTVAAHSSRAVLALQTTLGAVSVVLTWCSMKWLHVLGLATPAAGRWSSKSFWEAPLGIWWFALVSAAVFGTIFAALVYSARFLQYVYGGVIHLATLEPRPRKPRSIRRVRREDPGTRSEDTDPEYPYGQFDGEGTLSGKRAGDFV
ncbi:sigma-70 family RNA polymerase sigma factor [Streptomyces sp. R08]|uniref:Sigma-70 family RNA polymerase sigma factor n=1 Tax=Streptomyces sp. R08 TaxID=3238624 RepID=A0AB39MS90_9ACTN